MAAGSDFLNLQTSSVPARNLTAWLVDSLRAAVHDGRLGPGTDLPATRALARDLGVSRGVVVEAYQRLRDEGLVSARSGSGTTVTSFGTPQPPAPRPPMQDDVASMPLLPLAPSARPADVEFDLSPGVPDLAAFPRAAWLRAEREVLRTATAADLGYGDPRGSERLRHELAGWLGRMRGVRTEALGVLVVAGVAQSLALVAQTLRSRGITRIAVEDPGSRGAREALSHWGLDPVPIPVDDRGMQVAQLANADVRSALLTPAHQFPTGVVLAPGRRRALLDWAADVDGLVIEDDYDAEHRYDRAPVPALQSSAPDRVVHTGSTSKTLAPGMRLGWLVPPAHLLADLAAAKHASDLGCPALPQLALARLLVGGDYDRHLRLVRQRLRARRDAVLAAVTEHLPEAHVEGVAAGVHVLLTLPELAVSVRDTDLADRIRADSGVLVHPLSWHRQHPGVPGLIVGYAAQSPDRLREAVRRMAGVVRTDMKQSHR